jgi:predicted 3-demethylubiquinone-9 3-methyltransferase (glyoxalase superfamily)/uncharacterized protein YndB with AHSA1/START domain
MPTDASPRHDLTITRTLDAPRALVFRVWTEPEHLAVWWGPHGFTNPECRADARPGGEISIRMVGHGFDHTMNGTFVEVVPPERLVFDSWLLNDAGETFLAIRNTITFADAPGGKTTLTMHAHVTHAGPGSEFPLEGMEDGWTQSLERLEAYVAGIRETNVTPFLWFNGNAEEAARFYTAVFRNSRIIDVTRYGEAGPGTPGSVMTVTFEVNGLRFIALNGGPEFSFTPAVSFMVHCATQAEVDDYWAKLGADGGTPIQCGWITDKFGITWQIVPDALHELLSDPDPKKAQAVMRAMMQMIKLDEPALRHAYAQA